MDEKIREELIELVMDWNGTGRNPCSYSGGQRLGLWKDNRLIKTLAAIKKIFYEEMRGRLPKESKWDNTWMSRPYTDGHNDYRKETIKLLKEMCGVK